MELTQVSQEHTKIAELSRKIGQILVERGDYEQAMHQFQLGLQYLEGIEHKELVRIYNEIGRVYWGQGKLKEAQEWTDKAFGLAERLLDADELARLLYYAGGRYFRQGSNQLAKNEPVSDSDGKCAASHRGFISRCRLVVSVTLFFVALVAGGLLIGTISARASTYLVAFMLVLFGISCDRVIVSN